MSKLGFMIPLWSGCQEYLSRALQTIQNKAARVVTKHGSSKTDSEGMWVEIGEAGDVLPDSDAGAQGPNAD